MKIEKVPPSPPEYAITCSEKELRMLYTAMLCFESIGSKLGGMETISVHELSRIRGDILSTLARGLQDR